MTLHSICISRQERTAAGVTDAPVGLLSHTACLHLSHQSVMDMPDCNGDMPDCQGDMPDCQGDMPDCQGDMPGYQGDTCTGLTWSSHDTVWCHISVYMTALPMLTNYVMLTSVALCPVSGKCPVVGPALPGT